MQRPNKFVLTEEHVKLLRNMYVDWNDVESGAPTIDPKRPYGNSSVAEDIVEILGWDRVDDYELTTEEYEAAMTLHEQTQIALQVVLTTGSFELGKYHKTHTYDDTSWVRTTNG